MNNINNQTPATVNQISNAKPKVKNSYNVLQGYIANSMNGGILKPIAWKRVMGGEFIKDYSLSMNIKILTPKTPSYQNLRFTVRTYWVPDSAVWKNAFEFESQRGGASVTKISKYPSLAGKVIPRLQYSYVEGGQTKYKNVNWTDTDIYRDSFVSAFLPRYLTGYLGTTSTVGTPIALPEINVLPIRAMIKIWNMFERHKAYDPKRTEYDADTVTSAEWNDIIGNSSGDLDYRNTFRAKRNNSYYTDYRTELLASAPAEPNVSPNENQLLSMVEWEARISELRAQANNEMMTDEMIVAKIRGSEPVKDKTPRLLSERSINLNYSAVTQTTYNSGIAQPEFQSLGQQGAFSYTNIENLSLFNYESFKESGTIIAIGVVNCDSVFETGIDRTLLDVTWDSVFRPDLKNIKNDVLLEIEKGTTDKEITQLSDLAKIQGYKRKFSEWFKLPNVVTGDMTTNDYYETDDNAQRLRESLNGGVIITQKTFQFFEKSDKISYAYDPSSIIPNNWEKKIWKDYTDLMIDKNQAVQNGVKLVADPTGVGSDEPIMIRGQNQVFFVGIQTCIADLPIDEEIKNNFEEWGEK